MDISKIMSADILDIIFDGRFKEYGAYDLRKSYNKRITYALVATLALCLLLFVGSILANSFQKEKKNEIIVQDVSLEDIKK